MDIARNTALNILIEYDKTGVYPNLSLKKHLRDISDPRDCSFISAIVYGVIEKRLLLDYYIGFVSSVKIKKINIAVLNILRIGLYQIMYMSVPKSAACNTSVELAKKNGQYKSAAFINAILRKLSTTYNEIELPQKSSAEYYSIKYSVNINLVYKLLDFMSVDKLEDFLNSKLDNKAIYIAVNTLKVSASELISLLKLENTEAQKTNFDGLLVLPKGANIEKSSAFKSGLYHVISLPSYLAASVLDARVGENIIDMCSAPGGKTFTLAYSCKDKACITAFDLHSHKITNLKNSSSRLNLKSIKPIQHDSTVYDNNHLQTADKILCDVPCSGLGMIFKKPDIKYNEIDFDTIADIQFKILTNASKYLKPGGRLVYSTCTINPQENSEIIRKFLLENKDFSFDKTVKIYNDVCGEYTFLPHIDSTDGFYIAVLHKKQ